MKRAYRLKAKKYHPDVYKGADAKVIFQEINEAYHTLIDIERRKSYDTSLTQNIYLYKKYGRYYENRQQNNSYENSYYDAASRKNTEQDEVKIFSVKLNNFFDKFLFYTMLCIGIVTIFFGSIDLFFSKWEGLSNLTGFLFGISFTSLLIYGWYIRSKADKRNIKTDFV